MKIIDKDLKPIAIKIARDAFANNPSMNWFLNPRKNRARALAALCEHCIDTAMLRGGAFISNDNCCVCLVYSSKIKAPALQQFLLELRFVFRCCGLEKVRKITQRNSHICAKREKGPHVYCLLLASNRQAGVSSVAEAKNFMFGLSQQLQLPMLVETCMCDNKKLYERFGFKVYNQCTIPDSDIPLWFLTRQPEA